MSRIIVFFLLFVGALAADDSKIVTLPSPVIYQGDYFAVGSDIEISGTVEGDVYALGGQVHIDGHVTGDVLVCGGQVEISGLVENNIRVLAGQATISGVVGYNVTAIGGSVNFAPSAKIGGNVVCTAGNTELASTIAGDVNVAASFLRVSGTIQKRLIAYVGGLRLTSKAYIGGDLNYRCSQPAFIDPEAKIVGQVVYHPSLVHRILKGSKFQKILLGSKIAVLMMNFLYSFVIGLILLHFFPQKVETALEALSRHPWKSLWYGVVLLIALPLASLLLLISILGVPFALTLIAVNVITFYTAKVFSVLWATEEAIKYFKLKIGRISALAGGLFIYFLLSAIPYVGFFFVLAALLFGLGAGMVASMRRRFIDRFLH